MRFLRSPKCSKIIVRLTLTTQKANPCGLFDWLFCSVVPSLGKFGSKTQNCQFKLIQTFRIPWWCSLFLFFDWKCLSRVNLVQKIKIVSWSCNLVPRLIWICRIQWFLGKFCPENQNCQFKLKFGTKTNSNMQNSKTMFTFSVFNHKYPSWANLIQKSKIVCSKWSLIQRLIRICRIKLWCPFYLF